jgi:hypothetical protein
MGFGEKEIQAQYENVSNSFYEAWKDLFFAVLQFRQ